MNPRPRFEPRRCRRRIYEPEMGSPNFGGWLCRRGARAVLGVMVLAATTLVGCGSGGISPSGGTPAGGASAAVETRITGGINTEPEMRPWRYAGANPQSWWCEEPNCTRDFANPVATITTELQDAKSLGAFSVRTGFPWPLLETSKGTFDWTRTDEIMAASRSVGEPILPVLLWTPQWAGGGSLLDRPASNVANWTEFVTVVVQRYGSQFTHGIEVWNEPDGGHYLYDGSSATYVSQILNPAYTAIKAANPSIKVLLAGSANDAGSCCRYLQEVLSAGAKFDVATFHNYSGNWSFEASSYRSLLDKAGRSSTPIWMTEFGVDSTQGNQSAAIEQVFKGRDPLQAAFWYNLRDTAAWNCCPPTLSVAAHWGLLNADFSQKPAFRTFQSLVAVRGAKAPPPPS